jgi:hypothetical protein
LISNGQLLSTLICRKQEGIFLDTDFLPWDDSDNQDWAKEVATWPWTKNGDVLRVEGKCPRCRHDISREVERAEATLRLVIPAGDQDKVEPVTIRCNCANTHPGRPESEPTGCGAAATIWLPLS